MKNGLIIENGVPVYYKDDKPTHAGIVKDGNDIYYIGSDGKAVKGTKYVHSSMTHKIVKHGTYRFGNDYKMEKWYYKSARGKRSAGAMVYDILHGKYHKSSSKKKKLSRSAKIAIVVAVAIVIVGLGFLMDRLVLDKKFESNSITSVSSTESSGENIGETEGLLTVKVPEVDEEVWLVSNNAKKLYTEDASASLLKYEYPYKPFYFKYSVRCFDSALTDDIVAKLYISEDQSMAGAKEFKVDPMAGRYAVDNLKVDTRYFYRFEVSLDEENYEFEGSFKTAASHRLITLPNLSNVRDVGGRKTADGKTVKQDMIIRGSEPDGLVDTHYYLKDEYIEYARELFGFKSDMDLRQSKVGYPGYKSRFGDDVEHDFFNSPSYASTLSEINWPIVKKIFSYFADESNYPIYLHCTHGADRTGTIVFLLDAVLGLSEEEMKMEYELSKLPAENLDPLINALDLYDGDTINEKVENFLIESVGITEAELDSIRSIMLTD